MSQAMSLSQEASEEKDNSGGQRLPDLLMSGTALAGTQITWGHNQEAELKVCPGGRSGIGTRADSGRCVCRTRPGPRPGMCSARHTQNSPPGPSPEEADARVGMPRK